MKITAGLGSVDDYLPYVEAGADAKRRIDISAKSQRGALL